MNRPVRRILLTTATVVAIFALAAPAFAAAPQFKAASSSVNNAGALVVSFDERGLGNENGDYTLPADPPALYACLNRGGNHPQAANKEQFEGQVSTGASIEPKNGRVVA